VSEEQVARRQIGEAVLIAGPTASGKSALALELALATGGVVINADSMQVIATSASSRHGRHRTRKPARRIACTVMSMRP